MYVIVEYDETMFTAAIVYAELAHRDSVSKALWEMLFSTDLNWMWT